jgi:hypothetical protein
MALTVDVFENGCNKNQCFGCWILELNIFTLSYQIYAETLNN